MRKAVLLALPLCAFALRCDRARSQVSYSTGQVDGLSASGGGGGGYHGGGAAPQGGGYFGSGVGRNVAAQRAQVQSPGARGPAEVAATAPPPAAPPMPPPAPTARAGGGGTVSPFGGLAEANADGDFDGARDLGGRMGSGAGRGLAARMAPASERAAANNALAMQAAQAAQAGQFAAMQAAGGVGMAAAARPSMPTQPQALALAPPAPPSRDEGPRAAIDPNGRFATTYRPGGGTLAAFEAAVTAGTVPASARELVSDLGARYAPDMAAPTAQQGALALRVDLERGALPPSGGQLRMRLALRSTDTAARARPPMSVHLVWDASGSMTGASMDNARAAARVLVEHLEATDTFSLVRFSDDAQLLVPATVVGPHRAQILHLIDGVEASGGTNISEGLRLGYREAGRNVAPPDAVRLVMLLSDGRATEGDTNRNHLAALAANAFQQTIQTSTFGVGTDYDGALMAALADYGAGGYYYLPDPTRIAHALTTELDARVQPVAQALELRVRLRPDVQLTETYGSRRLSAEESARVRAQEVVIDQQVAARDHIAANRQEDREGGMRFFIPGFARADRHVLLLGLQLPAGVGERPLAAIELRYKDRLTNRNVTQELPVRVRYADSDAASLASLDASVVRTVQGFEAGQTLLSAARSIEAGHRDAAFALLNERAELLRGLSQRLNEPRFNEDAGRLTRFAVLTQGQSTMSDPLVLALLLDSSGRGLMH